jgi:ATP-dependent DNA helicase RecQ
VAHPNCNATGRPGSHRPIAARAAAGCLLDHLLACLPAGARGTDQLAETTLGKLLAALEADLLLKAEKGDHAQGARPRAALAARAGDHPAQQGTCRLPAGDDDSPGADWKRKFMPGDFAPLKLHYDEQVVQIHVMAEYVQRGLRPWPMRCT